MGKTYMVENRTRDRYERAKCGGIDIAAELRRRYFFPVVGSYLRNRDLLRRLLSGGTPSYFIHEPSLISRGYFIHAGVPRIKRMPRRAWISLGIDQRVNPHSFPGE